MGLGCAAGGDVACRFCALAVPPPGDHHQPHSHTSAPGRPAHPPTTPSPPPTRRGARAFGLLATFAAAVLVGLIMASWLCARPRKPPMRFCPPPPKPPKRSRKAPKVVMVAAVPGFADTVVAVLEKAVLW